MSDHAIKNNYARWKCVVCSLQYFVQVSKTKSNLSFYSLYYTKACNELSEPTPASLRLGNTAPFEEMSHRWRAVGNTVSYLTGSKFEAQTSRFIDERVTAQPPGRLTEK